MITFVQGNNITVTEFQEPLNKVLEYWQGIGTVRKFKGKLFIQNVSFPYTTELLKKWGIPHQILTEIKQY